MTRRAQGFYNSAFAASQPGSGGTATPLASPAYLWGWSAEQVPPNNGGSAGSVGSTNNLNIVLMYVPYAITITRITIQVVAVAAGAGIFASFGLYDLTGTKVVDSGLYNVSLGQPTGIKTNVIAPVTIQPGFYWFAQTCNGSAPTFLNWAASTNPQTIMNVNANRNGIAGATVGGALPANFGVFTPGVVAQPIYCLFEP